jgi:hypothetical protein
MSFARPRDLGTIQVHPWPWTEPGVPYFVVNPPIDPDGHGGYGRNHSIDPQGLPYRIGPSGRRLYDPLLLARFSLKMLTLDAAGGCPDAGRRAQAVLEPLLASGESTGVWAPGPAPDRMVGTRPSGMIQGVVLSALLRLSRGADDSRLRGVVDRGFEALAEPIERGGAVSELGDGLWIEEIPRDPPRHVLNGGLYGLFGVYDLADAQGDPRARALAADVERGLRSAVGQYCKRFGWSAYAIAMEGRAPVASLHYHESHVVLLDVVARRVRDARFAEVSQRWRAALASRRTRACVAVWKTAEANWTRALHGRQLREG